LGASPKLVEASFPGKNGLLAFPGTDSNGDTEIFTSRLDGSSLKQRTNAVGTSNNARWSPDGTKIAYQSNRDGHDYEIFVKDLTTDKVSQLTDNFENSLGEFASIIHDQVPAWSPDGTKIVFSRNVAESNDYTCYRMVVMDADGSNEKELTIGCSDSFVEQWSPDGTKIAYHRNGDIWKMNPDGSGKDRLTFSPADFPQEGYEDQPIWSPNGSKIIFSRFGPEGEGVVMMNVDGTNKTNVPGLQSTFRADWQPVPTSQALGIASEGSDEGGARTPPTSPAPSLAPSSPNNRVEGEISEG
jgi:Tol biopolymer transport system component